MKPVIGQTINYGYIGKAIIRVVRPAGTIDVERVSDGRWFRISGLSF